VKFGDIPVREAAGAVLAHSLRVGNATFKKGRVLGDDDLSALTDAGYATVTALRMEPGDLGENDAAVAIAELLAGNGLTLRPQATGRCNLHADADGVAVIDAAAIDALNAVDEAVTVATVPRFARVKAGEMAATVKIITFGVSADAIAKCRAAMQGRPPAIAAAPFRPMTVGLVQTRLPGIKESVIDKTVDVTAARLRAIGATLAEEHRCDHAVKDVATALAALKQSGCDVALALGASAIADREDVIPAAVVACGGTIEHFGMPVDPGNLMLLAEIGDMTVLGLPGSARSPRLHGFDWVLERIAAGLTVTGADLTAMGVGGLLKEIPTRPTPRELTGGSAASKGHNVAAIVLAAGRSQRMGAQNKMLAEVGGRPMVTWAVEAALESACDPVIVITGHEPEALRDALAAYDVEFVHNPNFADGISTSMQAGLAALPADAEGMVVCLGDMPDVTPTMIDRLVEAFNPDGGAAICIPTVNGQRGNPTLFGRRFFAEMGEASGDKGARFLLDKHPDAVAEVPMDDDAVLTDLDTLDALAAHEAARGAP
jgi:molybdenum cofactor cytidylyltransferase